MEKFLLERIRILAAIASTKMEGYVLAQIKYILILFLLLFCLSYFLMVGVDG